MPQYTSMLKFHTGKTHLYPVRFSWMLSIQLTFLFSKPVSCLWLEEFIYYLYQSWNYSSKTFSGWIYSVNEANTVLKGFKQKQLWSESQMAFHKQLLLSHCSVCVFFCTDPKLGQSLSELLDTLHCRVFRHALTQRQTPAHYIWQTTAITFATIKLNSLR